VLKRRAALTTYPVEKGQGVMADSHDTNAREEWKAVVGFEGCYEVSNRGRVRSLDRVVIRSDGIPQPQSGKVLRQQRNPKRGGRLSVHLCREDLSRHRITVHRLMLEAFVGPCPEGMEACHGDDNHLNNVIDNLRWDTKRNNMVDRDRNGKTVKGLTHGNAKLTDDDIREMRRLRSAGAKLSELAERYGIAFGQIGAIVRGKAWKHVV
jgi:hypothetical protein